MVDADDADGRTDGRWLDGYTINSPCEPNGSGELKMTLDQSQEMTSTLNTHILLFTHLVVCIYLCSGHRLQ